MLASTIQFSKYGQDNQPHHHHTPENPPNRETTHPSMRTHQQFGESRPQPPITPTHISVTVTQKKQSQPPNPQVRRPGPIPQDPTARLSHSLTHARVPRTPKDAVLTRPEELLA
jgi:hypothetical protein